MHLRILSSFFVALLVLASCGGSTTDEQSQPSITAVPAPDTIASPVATPDTEPSSESDDEWVPFCEAEVPTDGPSIDALRSDLAPFREPGADVIKAANAFTSYPEIPTSDAAIFVGFSTSMEDKGSGEVSFGTTLAYREPDALESVSSRYQTYAEENGYSFEREDATPQLIIMTLTSTETQETIKVTFTPSGTGKPTAGLDIQFAASGQSETLGDPSRWLQWHTEEFPLVEGACYRGGGAATNVEHPDVFATLGRPGDNLTADLAYPDMTGEDFEAAMIANAEGAGFTVEAGSIGGTFKLSKDDYTIDYQWTLADSINGILASASVNYPPS